MKSYIFNLSFLTNLISILFILAGVFSPVYSRELYNIGVFAFSGAITNWFAIYMLFEKIPGLYGSGVIPNRFEEFKSGIKRLIMVQFFTKENLDRFLKDIESSTPGFHWERINEVIDYKKIFGSLLEVVKESPFGGMIMMFGGERAIAPLEEPFTRKMKTVVAEIVTSESFKAKLKEMSTQGTMNDNFLSQVEKIVEHRLGELTPKMVKDIVQEMIREHLGWLVVWGGVFGGLIGLLSVYVPISR